MKYRRISVFRKRKTKYFGNYNSSIYITDHPDVIVSKFKGLTNFVTGHLLPCVILILIIYCCRFMIRSYSFIR